MMHKEDVPVSHCETECSCSAQSSAEIPAFIKRPLQLEPVLRCGCAAGGAGVIFRATTT